MACNLYFVYTDYFNFCFILINIKTISLVSVNFGFKFIQLYLNLSFVTFISGWVFLVFIANKQQFVGQAKHSLCMCVITEAWRSGTSYSTPKGRTVQIY